MNKNTAPKARSTLIAAAILIGFAGGAAHAADADNGRRLAERWCAACHIISPDQHRGNTDAPPFSQIARIPGFDASKITLFLLDPHPKMPDMGLTRNEAADLAAYIASQR
jgi:mono/diheme cytochrome c family protein